jgi:hypothetical protein
MSTPVVVTVSHKLGREEATRRLRSGLERAHGSFAGLTLMEQTWTGDQLAFRAGALGQTASGTVAVADDHVRIELQLPWLLAKVAEKAKALMQREGQLLLEKK